MQTFYAYGDIHNHVMTAQAFLDRVKPEKVIWLGDFTDNFLFEQDDDGTWNPERAYAATKRTARFIQQEIIDKRPQDKICLSNHDVAYRFYKCNKYSGWGYTENKRKAFYSEFKERSWERFELYHKEIVNGQEVFFSHAGLYKMFFPFQVFCEKHLKRISDIAICNGNREDLNVLLDHTAGPIWYRWPLPIFDGICQVVGHTPQPEPALIKPKDCQYWNLNVDCAKRFCVKFTDDGVFSVDLTNGNEKLIEYANSVKLY